MEPLLVEHHSCKETSTPYLLRLVYGFAADQPHHDHAGWCLVSSRVVLAYLDFKKPAAN
jgi:hypothetical protein